MSTTDAEPRFDLFISYAHKDNEGEHVGRITALKDWIEAEYQRITSRKLEIFFDVLEIRSMDQWQQRILVGLQQSRVMLAVLSPNYFTSTYCRKEWEEYLDQELAHALPGEGIAPIYVLKHPAFEDYDIESPLDRWLQNLKRRQWVNCVEWWPEGQRALEREGVRKQLAEVNERIVQRLDRARRRDKSPTNLPRYNKRFVGRTDELYQIREQLIRGQVGALTAVNGIGGIGKSALALVYGYAYGHEYPGGRFWIPAAGLNDLRGSLIVLAPKKGVHLTQDELQRPDYAFEKMKTAFEQGPPALLVLDNVDDPNLLDPARRDTYLPAGDHIHVLATTRLDPRELHEVECVPIDALPAEAALDLLARYRPIADTLQDDEWKAALEIVNRLGGHALAVEVVAVYLSRHPDISHRNYLTMLEREGITLVETTGADKFVRLSRHVERSIGRLLAPTLDSLTPVEVAVVQWSALLPPDHVPLPWIEAFLNEDFPEVASQAVAQTRESIRSSFARLEGLRLLVPGEERRLGRVHRIVQAVVADRLLDESRDSLESRLVSRAIDRADALETKWGRDCSWEVGPLHAFVVRRLEQETREVAAMAGIVAQALNRIGKRSEGRQLMHRYVGIMQKRAAQRPDDVVAQHDWCGSLVIMGQLDLDEGNPNLARRYFEQSLEIAQCLVRELPANEVRQRDLSVSLERLGTLNRQEGKPDEARRCFTQVFVIRQRLASAFPNSIRLQWDLAGSLESLGQICLDEGKPADARSYFHQCSDILSRVSRELHDDIGAQRDWSVSLARMGDLSLAQGNLDEARGYYQQALEVAQCWAQALPDDAVAQRDWAVALQRLGRLSLQETKPGDARGYFNQVLEISERLARDLPDDVSSQGDWGAALDGLGYANLLDGKPSDARSYYQQASEIYERLAGVLPDNSEVQRCWCSSLNTIGVLGVREGKLDDARRCLFRALEIRERLACRLPDDFEARRDLSMSYYNLADLARGCGKAGESDFYLAKCRNQLRSMRDKGMNLDAQAQQLLADLESLDFLPDHA